MHIECRKLIIQSYSKSTRLEVGLKESEASQRRASTQGLRLLTRLSSSALRMQNLVRKSVLDEQVHRIPHEELA